MMDSGKFKKNRIVGDIADSVLINDIELCHEMKKICKYCDNFIIKKLNNSYQRVFAYQHVYQLILL